MPPAQTLPLLAAGASVTYEVIFGPLSAGSHQGTLEAFGLNPNTPVLTVPLSGSGAGAELCVEPTPVVFGTRMIGAATTRQVTLISCGSDTVNISAAELPAPTSTEYSFAPVSLPLSIPSGARSTVSLTYTGVDAGRE